MKKETKKLIAAGIVMALSCGVWGSVSAADIAYKLDQVPADIYVNGEPVIPKGSDTVYGVNAGEQNVKTTEGTFDNVDVGVYATNATAGEAHTATINAKDIKISATHQEKNVLTGTLQIGAQAKKGGEIYIGGEETDSVSIIAGNHYAYLSSSSPEKVKNPATNNYEPTGRYKLIYMPGAATGLYTNTTASSGKAMITVNGKKIGITAEALGDSCGSRASTNSSILVGSDTTENVSIEAHGGSAKAVENGGSTVIDGKDILVKATSQGTAYGVNTNKANANTTIGSANTTNVSLKVDGGGSKVYGLYTNGSATAKLQGKTVAIDVKGNVSSGVLGISTKGTTEVEADDATLSVTGNKNVYGIEFSSTSGLASVQAKNTLKFKVKGEDGSATGITGSFGTAKLQGDVVHVSVEANASTAPENGIARVVKAQGNAKVIIGEKASEVNLSAKGTTEAYVVDSSAPSTIQIGTEADKIHISSEAGKIAHGISLDNGAKLSLGGADSEITIDAKAGGETIGILAMRETNSNKGGAVVDVKGKSLVINAVSDTNDSIGIHVQNSSTTAEDNKATVNIEAENTSIQAKTALSVMSQGVLKVNSNLTTNGKNAILTRGNSTVNINTDGNHTTNLNGDIVFDFDKTTGVDSDVNVNLSGEGSQWTGNTRVDWANDSGKPDEAVLAVRNMKLNLSDGATWTPTAVKDKTTDKSGSNYVALNQLSIDHGVVNLDSDKLDANSPVKVEKISGNGTITTNSLDNKLVIDDKATGTKLKVEGSGEIGDKILAGKATLKDLAGTAKVGNKTASDVVETQNGIIAGRMFAKVGADGEIDTSTIKTAVQQHNQAVSSMASLSLMTWRQENNDMNKRLGEVRASEGSQGVWARMARGQSKYGQQGIKNQYNYYQLGYDSKISDDWILGGAFTYTNGDSSYTNGSGTNKHTGFAVYGSNLRDDGSFIDLIAKYAHMKNDFDVNGGVGSGDYSTNGLSFSAEYGKRFHQESYWIEPQAELTYGRVSSADFTTKRGAKVHQDSMDSLVGRLGFSLGKDIKQGNVYVRASYLYDFQGDTSVTMSKGGAATPFKTDLGGGWWEFGVGTNLDLGHDTHFYLDVETTAGGDVDTPWQWNAGVRYSF